MRQYFRIIGRTVQQITVTGLLGLWVSLSFADTQIRIETPRIDARPDFFELTADIRFDLPKQVLDALDNGVPVTLVIQTEVTDPDAWFWQKPIESHELRYRLRYHALARTHQVTDLGNQATRNFQTLHAALRFIGSLHRYPITRVEQLTDIPNSRFRMRVYLDIESLPLPLRSIAYMTPGWHINSDWVDIPIKMPGNPE